MECSRRFARRCVVGMKFFGLFVLLLGICATKIQVQASYDVIITDILESLGFGVWDEDDSGETQNSTNADNSDIHSEGEECANEGRQS